jgi:hypothetical protein
VSPTPATWIGLVLLAVPALAMARGPRAVRSLALTVALMFAVLARETAVHSVHHLKNPREAERCSVYWATAQLTGLTAASATPDLVPLVPSRQQPTTGGDLAITTETGEEVPPCVSRRVG